MKYKNNKTGGIYRRLATAIDTTNERDGLVVIVYCPDDNEHSIFVREVVEFHKKFALIDEANE